MIYERCFHNLKGNRDLYAWRGKSLYELLYEFMILKGYEFMIWVGI